MPAVLVAMTGQGNANILQHL